jgi:hypothetical protein
MFYAPFYKDLVRHFGVPSIKKSRLVTGSASGNILVRSILLVNDVQNMPITSKGFYSSEGIDHFLISCPLFREFWFRLCQAQGRA